MLSDFEYMIECEIHIQTYLQRHLTSSIKKSFVKINDINSNTIVDIDNADFLKLANTDGRIIYYKNIFDKPRDLLIVPNNFTKFNSDEVFYIFQNNFKYIEELDSTILRYLDLLFNPSKIEMYIVDGYLTVKTVIVDKKIKLLKDRITEIKNRYGSLNLNTVSGIKLEKKSDTVNNYLEMLKSKEKSFSFIELSQKEFKLPNYI